MKTQCPSCSSTKIKVVETYYESNPDKIYQDMLCKTCKKEWTELCTHSRIQDLCALATVIIFLLAVFVVLAWLYHG